MVIKDLWNLHLSQQPCEKTKEEEELTKMAVECQKRLLLSLTDEQKAIFEEWRKWYKNTDSLIMFEVTSYNTFSFTLGCLLYDENLEYIGYIRITSAHNYLYLV